jgi:hypothetical protein
MRVQVFEPSEDATGRERYQRVTIWPEDGTPFRFTFAYIEMSRGEGLEFAPVEVWIEQDVADPFERDAEGLPALLARPGPVPAVTGPAMRDLADRFAELDAVARANLIGALGPNVRVRGRRPRHELTDGFLREVAERYRGHREAGRSPVLTLAREHGVSRRTASNWVQKARAAGLLGPARQGRSGEEKS